MDEKQIEAARARATARLQELAQAMKENPDAFDDSNISAFCGMRLGADGPGSDEFDRQLKIIASAMGKVGSVVNAPNMYPGRIGGSQDVSEDVLAAQTKLAEAHKLLLAAEALMRSAHVAARSK